MQPEDSTRITTLQPRQKPTARAIIELLKESIIAASAMDVFNRLYRCHRTRECLWEGRQHDGRLGEEDTELPVFRWKGAPDIRVPLADKLVRWMTMLRMTVFNRGDLRIAPRRAPEAGTGMNGQEMAGVWQGTMEYFLDVRERHLSKQYELWSTCVEEFGYGIIMADWQRKTRNERVEVTLQSLTDHLVELEKTAVLEATVAAADDPALVDPEAVLTEEVLAGVVQRVAEDLQMMLLDAGAPSPEQLGKVMALDPRMSEAEAKRVLRGLAAKPTEPAYYIAPKQEGGVLKTQTLIPWVNCLHPYDMSGDGSGEWVATPVYWSETKMREMAQAEGWDKAGFKELMENQRNKFFTEMYNTNALNIPEWALNGVGIGLVPDTAALEKMPRWLAVYVWMKVADKDGRPMVYKAVVHPNLPDRLLLWEPTDLEELPMVCETAEPVLYAMMAKGVCDVVVDKQNFVKDTLDSEGARGQLGSNPPLLRTSNVHVGMRPGIELYAKRSGQSFDGTKFVDVPQVDQGAINNMKEVERLVDEYYFRGATADEEDKRMFREAVIYRGLRCWKELVRLVWRLVQENVTELQVSRIQGREVRLDARRDQLQGEADIHIGVHLDGYSKDGAEKFIDVMGKLIQADRSGSIDWAEATNIAAQLLSPTYARRLILSAEAANGRTIDDQEQRITKILAGIPVRYEERVSNPQLRQQVLDTWAQVPGNLQKAQMDPVVAEMLAKEQEMLVFQEEQQVTNPVIGRTGVRPNQPASM